MFSVWPWSTIAKQRREIERLKALVALFDHDGDGKPGGRKRADFRAY